MFVRNILSFLSNVISISYKEGIFMNFIQLENEELNNISGGTWLGDAWEDCKTIYRDLRDGAWDGIGDFFNGFADGFNAA